MMLTPIFIAAGFGIAVTMLFMGVISLRPTTESRARGRLASMAVRQDTYRREETYLQDERVSGFAALDGLLRGRAWTERARHDLERAGIPLRVGEYAAIRVLSVMVGFLVARTAVASLDASNLINLVLLGLGVLAGVVLPPMYVRRRRAKRKEAYESQLVEMCDIMAAMLQSGYAYTQALIATGRELEAPLRDEIQRMLDKIRLGGDVDEALEEMNARLDSKDFDIVVSAISVQRKSGGNLSEILSGVALTMRERQSFLRDVNALTAQQRYSAIIVATVPMILVAALLWMSPEMYGRLFTQTAGQIMLGVAMVLDLAGYFVIRRITRLDV
jgi:tight adherence protein B